MLKFLGRGSGFSYENNSAYMESGNNLILIDCGYTVFNKARKKLDLSKYNTIYIVITHLHPDHAGSLGQMIMYLGYQLSKKPIIVSACEKMQDFLDNMGIDSDLYDLYPNALTRMKFIKTHHSSFCDAYGFEFGVLNDENYRIKRIVYTGDTFSLEPFEPYLDKADELYVDVSKGGIVHLQIDEVLPKLLEIQKRGTKVYLMHLDDEEYIARATEGNIEFAKLVE